MGQWQRKKLSHDKIAKWARSIVQELSSSFRNISLPIPKVFNCLSQSNLKFFQVIDQGAFSSVQFSLSHVRLFATPWTAAHQASLSITNPWSLLRLMPTKLVMPYSHLILCHPLLLPPSIIPSIRIFSKESVLYIMWPKYWSFHFSASNEHSGLISFRMDWLDLLKLLLQLHNSKASIVQCSAFFIVQLSNPYMTYIHSFD